MPSRSALKMSAGSDTALKSGVNGDQYGPNCNEHQSRQAYYYCQRDAATGANANDRQSRSRASKFVHVPSEEPENPLSPSSSDSGTPDTPPLVPPVMSRSGQPDNATVSTHRPPPIPNNWRYDGGNGNVEYSDSGVSSSNGYGGGPTPPARRTRIVRRGGRSRSADGRRRNTTSASAQFMDSSVTSEASTAITNGDDVFSITSSMSSVVTADMCQKDNGKGASMTNGTTQDRKLTGRPGVVGIENHNSTCFINAVVQCLARTSPLVADLTRATSGFDADGKPLSVARNDADVSFRSIGSSMMCLSSSEDDLLSSRSNGGGRRSAGSGRRKSKTVDLDDHNHVTGRLTKLVSGLLTGNYSTRLSKSFYDAVCRVGRDWYNGVDECDAHEFLVWLLDRLGSELNCKVSSNDQSNNRTKKSKRVDSKSNDVTLLTSSDDGVVSQLFNATCRSTVVCPGCNNRSEQLEPYMSVSLPITCSSQVEAEFQLQKQEVDKMQHWQAMYVVVVRQCDDVTVATTSDRDGRKPRRYGLETNPRTTTVQRMKQFIGQRCKLPESQLVMAEVTGCQFKITLHEMQEVSALRDARTIYAFETRLPELENGTTVTDVGGQLALRGKRTEQRITIIALSIDVMYGRRLSQPFVVRVKRGLSYSELQNTLMRQQTGYTWPPGGSSSARNGTLDKTNKIQANNTIIAEQLPFRLRLLDGIADLSPYFDPNAQTPPLLTATVQQALINCTAGYGPQHIKLIVEWDHHARLAVGLRSSSSSDIIDDVTVEDVRKKQTRQQQLQQLVTSYRQQQMAPRKLTDCLATFTQRERLDGDNAWMCSNCRKKQHGAVKKLTFTSLPEVLVLHLNRFKQERITGDRTKLDTLVEFPVNEDLDLRQFFDGDSISSAGAIYQLYAVCNHVGSTPQTGHYTAFCRNPMSNQWYSFDDENVSAISTRSVLTNNAYLLFYARKRSSRWVNDHNWLLVTWSNRDRREKAVGKTAGSRSVTSFESREDTVVVSNVKRGEVRTSTKAGKSAVEVKKSATLPPTFSHPEAFNKPRQLGRRSTSPAATSRTGSSKINDSAELNQSLTGQPLNLHPRPTSGSPPPPRKAASMSSVASEDRTLTGDDQDDANSTLTIRSRRATFSVGEQATAKPTTTATSRAPTSALRKPPHGCLKNTGSSQHSVAATTRLLNVPLIGKIMTARNGAVNRRRANKSFAGGSDSEEVLDSLDSSFTVSRRNRHGRLFRSLSAGRVSDPSPEKVKARAERLHVRWDPTSDIKDSDDGVSTSSGRRSSHQSGNYRRPSIVTESHV